VQANAQLGSVNVTLSANIRVTGVQAVGQTGNVNVFVGIVVRVTGVQGVGQVGTIAPAANANVYVTGVQGNTILANVLVWGQIDDIQVPNWQNVFYYKYDGGGGSIFGGAPFATIGYGAGYGAETNDPPVTWTDVDDEETTDWQLVAA